MSQKCIGCDTPIPYGATKCPMCGATTTVSPANQPAPSSQTPTPIVQHVTEVRHVISQEQPILIEATGKKWKKLYLWAWLLAFLGIVSCSAGTNSTPPESGPMIMAAIFWAIAIGMYIRARVGAWWNHG